MHIVQQIIWRKKLIEYDKNPKHTYLRNNMVKYLFPLDVYIS